MINADLLPALTDIVIQPHPFSPGQNGPLDPKHDHAADSPKLLLSIIEKKLLIKRLHLLIPEIDGYQAWLNEIEKGALSELTEFYYVLPVILVNESQDAYKKRLTMALNTILNAVKTKKVPHLKQIVITGEILKDEALAPHLQIMREIQDLVLTQG